MILHRCHPSLLFLDSLGLGAYTPFREEMLYGDRHGASRPPHSLDVLAESTYDAATSVRRRSQAGTSGHDADAIDGRVYRVTGSRKVKLSEAVQNAG